MSAIQRFRCIINIIRYFRGRNFYKNMFLRLCGQFSKMSLPENLIEAGKFQTKLNNFWWNDVQINLLVLNHKNIFCEIKFLICIHEIPSVKFAIFETQFAKVSFLEIFSIFSLGIINLINGKGSYSEKHRKRYLIFAFLTRYFYTVCYNNVSE